MSDTEQSIEKFLNKADRVYDEYERGRTDPDAALRVLESHIDDLRDATE
jgi:hypothetical protein